MKNVDLLIQIAQHLGELNIYGLPIRVNCYSFGFNKQCLVYSGELPSLDVETKENLQKNECILVKNRLDGRPTAGSMELFAYRLYEAQRTIDTNISALKTPVLLLVEEKQRLTMENVYNEKHRRVQYEYPDNRKHKRNF